MRLYGAKSWEGDWTARGRRFGVVVSRFNETFTKQLLDGALFTLLKHGARPKDVHVALVPGAFEVPLGAKKLIARVKPHAVLTLSVVIRGRTKHFDQVVTQCARGVRELSMKSGVPVILGMVSAERLSDVVNRVRTDRMNKGREWALSAIEMANLSRKLDAPRPSSLRNSAAVVIHRKEGRGAKKNA